MRASRSFLRNAGLAAILAVLLNALWPLLAHAKPANSLMVPVCTVAGETHFIELERGDSPLDKRSSAQHEHCKLCVFGTERPVGLAASTPVLSLDATPQQAIFPSAPSLLPSAFVFIAQSRAPPAVS